MADFAGFDIEFDNYGSTQQPGEPRRSATRFGPRCARPGWSSEQEVTQLYDPRPARSWPTASSRAPAPSASRPNQYGDSCDKCGAHYSPTDLIDPVSTLSGATPEIRKADHLFVNIEQLHGFLERVDADAASTLQPEVANYLQGPFPGRAAARLGRLAAGALLRLRDSRQPGQLLVRLVRRPDRLHRLDAAVVRPARREARRLVAQPGDARSTTSSARTSPISTRCSGRRCSRRPASACRRRSTSTAS